jgi:hypothetical protein
MSSWSNNPIEESSDLEESLATPSILSSYVQSQTPSKLPPFEHVGQHIMSKNACMKLELSMQRTIFLADGNVEGELELSSKDCKIGKIQVYLTGIEGTPPFNENFKARKLLAPFCPNVCLCRMNL